jgi:hypothetical protein
MSQKSNQLTRSSTASAVPAAVQQRSLPDHLNKQLETLHMPDFTKPWFLADVDLPPELVQDKKFRRLFDLLPREQRNKDVETRLFTRLSPAAAHTPRDAAEDLVIMFIAAHQLPAQMAVSLCACWHAATVRHDLYLQIPGSDEAENDPFEFDIERNKAGVQIGRSRVLSEETLELYWQAYDKQIRRRFAKLDSLRRRIREAWIRCPSTAAAALSCTDPLQRVSAKLGIPITRVVCRGTSSPAYTLELDNGAAVPIGAVTTLLNQQRVRELLMHPAGRVIPRLDQATWADEICNDLLAARVLETDPQRDLVATVEALAAYLQDRFTADRRTGILEGRPHVHRAFLVVFAEDIFACGAFETYQQLHDLGFSQKRQYVRIGNETKGRSGFVIPINRPDVKRVTATLAPSTPNAASTSPRKSLPDHTVNTSTAQPREGADQHVIEDHRLPGEDLSTNDPNT